MKTRISTKRGTNRGQAAGGGIFIRAAKYSQRCITQDYFHIFCACQQQAACVGEGELLDACSLSFFLFSGGARPSAFQ